MATAKALLNAKYDRQRRDLLLLLREDFGHFLTIRLIGDALGHLGHALTDEAVRFHLVYLEDKHMVELQRLDVPESRERNVIAGAKLLAAGVDLLDDRRGVGVASF